MPLRLRTSKMKLKWKLLQIKVGARKWKLLQKPMKNYRDGNDMGVAPRFSRTWQDYCSDMPWQVTRDSCFLSTLAAWLVHLQGRSSLGSERWKQGETNENHSCVAAASASAPWLPGAAEDMALSYFTELTEAGNLSLPSALPRPFLCLQFMKTEDNAHGFLSPNLPASESIFSSSAPVETEVPAPSLTSSDANCVGFSETLVSTLKIGIMIVPILLDDYGH